VKRSHTEALLTQSVADPVVDSTAAPRRGMKPWQRALFFLVAWLIVLMPFLFWRGTWFGKPLSDEEITQYLHDDSKPRHIQHALVQIGERIARARARGAPPATDVGRWYPELVRLAIYSVEEVRNTDAWIMGQDPSRAEFHATLLTMLHDQSPNVRSNAALSLVSFGDAAGHAQIVAMLQSNFVTSPASGIVRAIAKPGDPIRTGTVVAHLENSSGGLDVRSPITGRIKSVAVRMGQQVAAGTILAGIDPGNDQAWEALRALYIVGTRDDLALVRQYEQPRDDMGERIRQQAIQTEEEILRRAR